jgi:hypothetical protein
MHRHTEPARATHTSWPSSQSISSDTRLATDMAATRRGCVHPTMPYVVYPSSCRYCVSCIENRGTI